MLLFLYTPCFLGRQTRKVISGNFVASGGAIFENCEFWSDSRNSLSYCSSFPGDCCIKVFQISLHLTFHYITKQ